MRTENGIWLNRWITSTEIYEKNKQTKYKWTRAQQLNEASFTEDSQTNLKHSLAVVPNFVMSFNYKDKIDWIQDSQ